MKRNINRVAVLLGGISAEREVSLVSGRECTNALLSKGYEVFKVDTRYNFLEQLDNLKPDVVFNALHGKLGEDGAIQGILEILRIPYTHSGVLASSVAMNKDMAKAFFRDAGLPVLNHIILETGFNISDISFDYPYVIKPVNGGSSVDVHIIQDASDWPTGMAKKRLSSEKFLAEPFVVGKELTVTVMGDRALAVTDIVSNSWYDYDAKYKSGGSEHILPADIPKEITQLCLNYALKAHLTLGCRGISRIDFKWNEKLGPKGLFILELNTQPGMTPTSLAPEQAMHVGVSFERLCEWLIGDASCNK